VWLGEGDSSPSFRCERVWRQHSQGTRNDFEDAFSSLVSVHLQTRYRLVLRITRYHEDADDSVQDAILKAYASLRQFQGSSRFSTWIGRIAINEDLMKLRKHKA
jgi:RNA polymerase sigma-70 factor (ECF subfamily)